MYSLSAFFILSSRAPPNTPAAAAAADICTNADNLLRLEALCKISHSCVLVGVVLVDVHLYLDLQHVLHHEVKYCYVFSYSCTFNDQIIWFGTDAGTLRTKHFSTNWSLDYFHRSSSNEMRAYKIEQE